MRGEGVVNCHFYVSPVTFREKNKTFRAQIPRSGDLCFRMERKERNRMD